MEGWQVAYERVERDLGSSDPEVRLRAVQLLKEAAYLEAALPLAKLVADPADDVQLEAIAAELNIFLAEKIIPRKRVGFLIEVRNRIAAENAFAIGPLALGPRPVPLAVLAALRAASRDQNPRVALEALYAFGVLAVEPSGKERRELLQASGPDLAAMIGVPDVTFRFAAIRVIARVFEKRAQDAAIDEPLGDAVISALNDGAHGVRVAAIDALGAMRYERAVQGLTELHQYYGKGEIADASLDALARIGHAASAPLLDAALTSKSRVRKRIAIEGLARLGDRARLAAIQAAAAADRDDGVQIAFTFASVMLASAPLDQLADSLLKDRVREQAWRYLLEAIPGRTGAFGRYAQVAAADQRPTTRDPDTRLRLDIADLLGLAGDAGALPIVEAMMKDRDSQVAAAATRAAARLRATRSPA